MTKPFFDNFFPPHIFNYISNHSMDFTCLPGEAPFNREQKEFLRIECDLATSRIVNLRQMHEDRIVQATHVTNSIEQADGLITDVPELTLAVRTADCLPIFIYDPTHEAIGLVHAGWKGTKTNIAQKAISKMIETYNTNPAEVTVAFGPCISAKHYEVSEEFKEYFPSEIIERSGKIYFDLALANFRQLTDMGVKEKNIYNPGPCTFESKEYFSYRRDGDSTGRMISLMQIKKGIT